MTIGLCHAHQVSEDALFENNATVLEKFTKVNLFWDQYP